MALSIKDPETDRLARELAQRTGESLTEAIRRALEERLQRVSRYAQPPLRDELRMVRERVAELPVRDRRTPEEILGYDDRGLPT
ncbi:MAG: type II toxin-antitoxin system VapB family antitoxin [Gemmatimonadota bacterium]